MWVAVFIVLLLLLIVAAAAVGHHFSNLILMIRTRPHSDIWLTEVSNGRFDPESFERLPKEEVSIPSPFGYELFGIFIPYEGSNKTVILTHGVTVSWVGSIKYMYAFRKYGFNVLMYDHRRHGRSGGTTTTYGLREKYDLKACVDWVISRCGKDGVIGIHGESMGAATALQHAAIDDRADFYVADCPYSDFFEQLAYRLKVEYGLPAFPLLHLTSFVSYIKSGFRFGGVSPIRTIRKLEKPVLFIHGDADTYIPKEMTIAMHDEKPGYKKLYLAPGADHAQSQERAPEEYERVLGSFLGEIGHAPQVQSGGGAYE